MNHVDIQTCGPIARVLRSPSRDARSIDDARSMAHLSRSFAFERMHRSKASLESQRVVGARVVGARARGARRGLWHPIARAALANERAHRAMPSSCVIVGGGPTGLALAIALARRGWNDVQVWERLLRPPASDSKAWGDPSRSYNVGLSGRGQRVLKDIGALDRVLDKCAVVKGRMDWGPDGVPKERLANKTYDTQVIQRDRLVACLLEEVEAKYSRQIKVKYNSACTGCEFSEDGSMVTLELGECGEDCDVGEPSAVGGRVRVPVVFGAEGNSMRSAVVREMDENSKCEAKIVRYTSSNARVYKTIPIYLPDNMRKDLNYSARTKGGVALEALPTKEGLLIGIMLVKPDDEQTCEALSNPVALKKFFNEQFPMFIDYIKDKDIEAMANSKFFGLPNFGYVANALNMGGMAALLGDTIHTVKPYFGLGVNSAWEDVRVLIDALDEADGDTKVALPNYSKNRAKDAEALVTLSRSFDGGFLTFVLPLIVDSMFHKIAPWLFMPNTIQMLQKEDWSFSDIQRRKWIDRFMQGAVISSAFAALFAGVCNVARQFVVPLAMKLLSRGGA